MSEQRTDFLKETESFEAFDLVTQALEQIDSYDASTKNVEVLHEAEARLKDALEKDKDPNYFKAQYFQAMIRYLEGDPRKASSQFRELGDISLNSAFGRELSYNIAAAHNASGNWNAAIDRFKDIINNTEEKTSEADVEVRLLTRAGLVSSCAGRIGYAQSELEKLKGQRSEEATASRTENEELIEKDSKEIEEQYQEAKRDARKIVDASLVKEAERIFRDAYTRVERQESDIELVPAKVPKKKRRVYKPIIIIVGFVLFIILVWAIYVELFVGWDHVF